MPENRIYLIDVEKIDPSPFQQRKYMDEDTLRELALSIRRDGLIEPIVIRPLNGRYQLIAGERRWRAVRKYTDLKSIEAKVITANDLKALRIAVTENLQREDLSAIETIESTVVLLDTGLIHDKEYASMGREPLDRVKALLGKLDNMRRSKERGYKVNGETEITSHKFMGRVIKIFNNLPKPLKWRSFYENDLPLLVQVSQDVKEVSIRNQLNRSQTRALETLKQASPQEFHMVTANIRTGSNPVTVSKEKDSFRMDLKDLSARDIQDIAEKAVKKEKLAEIGRNRVSPSSTSKTRVFMMNRLGIPIERMVARFEMNWRTVKKYSGNPDLVRSVQNALKKGRTVEQTARDLDCPEPLVWSIALEGKDDLERFRELGWGIRTWDFWSWNDCDRRFGDDWPGRIPAQMIAHILFYFSDQNDLVFDPMAGGGVVPDTCLALNRRCWSFDMVDRLATRPEIEPWYWDIDNLQWPVRGNILPDLIIFDPPYFSKKSGDYDAGSISGLTREEYLKFLEDFFALARENSKKGTKLALINADWRDFQGTAAVSEARDHAILISDCLDILKKSGWYETHIIQAPMSSERFNGGVVTAMQKKRILGVTSRYIIIAKHRL